MKLLLRAFLAILLFTVACAEDGKAVLVGAVQTDITPVFEPYQDTNGNRRYDEGEPFEDLDADGKIRTLWLGGFGPRQPTGVHDRLSARTVVVQVGDEIFSLTALDALGVSTGRIEAIRRRAVELLGKEAFSTERMIIASTHTHQAPDTIGIFAPNSLQPGWDADYLDLIVERAAESIRAAYLARRPASLRFAVFSLPTVVIDIVPPDVTDPQVAVLQALDEEERNLAVLLSVANHPEAAWAGNTLVSADYPGALRAGLEEKFGGLAVFFAGALGMMQTPARDAPAGFERVQAIAAAYLDAAEAALLQSRPLDNSSLRWKKAIFTAPLENFELRLAVEGNIAEGYFPYLYQSQQEPCASAYGCFDLPLYLVELGKEVVLITVPGEMVPELALGGISRPPDSTGPFPDTPLEPVIADHLHGKERFLIGLAGAEIGYIYPKIEYDPDAYYSYHHSVGPSVAAYLMRALCDALDDLR